ncbi:NAD(P)-dependent dehydrogenase (short-subunit alcohol dehydrogenase family) [Arthrobacter sp. OAP107]
MLFPSMVSCDSSRLEGIWNSHRKPASPKPCIPHSFFCDRLKLCVGLAMLNARFCTGLRKGVVRARKATGPCARPTLALMGAATSQISYSASKGGVLSMSRELGVHFAREGIRVSALCPGPVNTPPGRAPLVDAVVPVLNRMPARISKSRARRVK